MVKRSIASSSLIASAIAAALVITGCFDVTGGGGGGPGRVTISGMVTSVDGDSGDVFGISIEARDPVNGKRLGKSTETGVFGAYQLKVPAKGLQRLIELIFATPLPFSETFSEFFLITKDSEVFLDVSLESPGQVIIDNEAGGGYQVNQKRIKIRGGKSFIFSGTEFGITTPQQADFTINGRSRDCIKAKNNSSVSIDVKNFSAANCANGILAKNNANLSIGASEDFEIVSSKNGVRSTNQAFAELVSGEVFSINSGDFGIGAGGQSTVIVDLMSPPVDCEIFGVRGDINEESLSATISVPAGCLVP
jgi:hypothetical protein